MLTLQHRLRTACREHGNVSFYNEYSGRSMYGKTCVGISGMRSDCIKVIAEVMSDIASEANDHGMVRVSKWFETLLNHDMDNMGRDMILYWPQLASIIAQGPDDANNG
jgi:hypothetical protein